MNTSGTVIINIKTDLQVKQKAQKVAKDLGLNLSTAINGFLRQFIRDKRVNFSLSEEKPSARLLADLKQSEEDYKNGDYYSFDNPNDAIKFLDTV
jgi:DNA-damage-inducible protein J